MEADMRFATRFAFAVTVALLLGSTAYASVSVDFVHPEKFRDPDFRSFSERNRLISEFRGYFETLAGRCLKKGQALRIDVLDVTLAVSTNPGGPISTTCASFAIQPRRGSSFATS
jgi:hypothetical protein